MLERLLNNRKEWNALKEVHEAKMAAIEEEKKAKEGAVQNAAGAKQGRRTHTDDALLCFIDASEPKQCRCQF